MVTRNTETKENREFWEFVDRTAEKAGAYPAWKRGGCKHPNVTRKAEVMIVVDYRYNCPDCGKEWVDYGEY